MGGRVVGGARKEDNERRRLGGREGGREQVRGWERQGV